MSGTEQVLFLVVVPAIVVAVIWALAWMGGPQAKRRYRPGRPYDFMPVWYVANVAGPPGTGDRSERSQRAVDLPGAGEVSVGAATGGASDRW